MVNILVPTDFSTNSKVAIQFAIKVANKLGGQVTLVHVINIVQPTRASIRLKLQSLEQEMVDCAKEDFEQILRELEGEIKTKDPIRYQVVKGSSFNDTIKKTAKKLRTGLIIMGTQGAGGMKKYILGTNTASVIEISHVPVLVTPKHGSFRSFKNVVYASDLKHLENELKTLMPYISIFGSTVHIIHVVKTQKEVLGVESKIEKLVQKHDYKNVIIRVMVGEKVEQTIEQYVTSTKSDLLAMFTHPKSFYDKLFNRSMTKQMSFQSKVPLLAFRQKN